MNPVIINEQRPNDKQWFALTGSPFEALRQAAPIENLLGFSTERMEVSGGDVPEDVDATYLTENADPFAQRPRNSVSALRSVHPARISSGSPDELRWSALASASLWACPSMHL